jgi:hypothetical protein
MAVYKYHTKRRQLTANDLTDLRKHAADLLIKIQEIEGAKAAAMREFDRELKPRRKDLSSTTMQLRTGIEEGSAHCRVVINPVTSTVKFFTSESRIDPDTNVAYEHEELFDELTFEQVGEAQLSVWQQDSEDDVDPGVRNDAEFFDRIKSEWPDDIPANLTLIDIRQWLISAQAANEQQKAAWAIGSTCPLQELYSLLCSNGLAEVLKEVFLFGEDDLEPSALFERFLDTCGNTKEEIKSFLRFAHRNILI